MAIVLSFFCKLWDCDNTSFDIIFQKERKKKFFYFIIPSVRQFLKGIGDEIFERREIEESENFKKIVKHCIREQGPTEQFFLCQKKKKHRHVLKITLPSKKSRIFCSVKYLHRVRNKKE